MASSTKLTRVGDPILVELGPQLGRFWTPTWHIIYTYVHLYVYIYKYVYACKYISTYVYMFIPQTEFTQRGSYVSEYTGE